MEKVRLNMHDLSIAHISVLTRGVNNHSSMGIRFKEKNGKGFIFPDVVSKHIIHEVEVCKNKFNDEFTKKYINTFNNVESIQHGFDIGLKPKKKICWLVISNYENLSTIFDEIKLVVKINNEFEELSLALKEDLLTKDSVCRSCPNLIVGSTRSFCVKRGLNIRKGFKKCKHYPKTPCCGRKAE